MSTPLLSTPLQFLVRNLNNFNVEILFIERSLVYFTRIMSRLSTALSNRLIWHYLWVKISCPLRYRPHKKRKNEKMTQLCRLIVSFVPMCNVVLILYDDMMTLKAANEN